MTLGKRIVHHRRRLGLTQEQLATQLGVTAQAVSKWENDQSCPDITMLPRLAEIFGISTDELLGREAPKKVHHSEVVDEEEDKDTDVTLSWGNKKKNSIGFAVCVVLVGVLTLLSRILSWDVSFWSILWPSVLLVMGFCGLFPRFSVFRLGMTLFGGYFLVDNLNLLPFDLSSEYIFPVCVVLFGLGLLIDSLRKPKKKQHIHFVKSDGKDATTFECSDNEDSFNCNLNFGQTTHLVTTSRLQKGSASVNFGKLTVDLSGVECVAINCEVEVDCAFGDLRLLVPSKYHIKCIKDIAFGGVRFEGEPVSDVAGVILLNASANFGQIVVEYI